MYRRPSVAKIRPVIVSVVVVVISAVWAAWRLTSHKKSRVALLHALILPRERVPSAHGRYSDPETLASIHCIRASFPHFVFAGTPQPVSCLRSLLCLSMGGWSR